jgi:hypothetical protein
VVVVFRKEFDQTIEVRRTELMPDSVLKSESWIELISRLEAQEE